jgi:hypothetical protein
MNSLVTTQAFSGFWVLQSSNSNVLTYSASKVGKHHFFQKATTMSMPVKQPFKYLMNEIEHNM